MKQAVIKMKKEISFTICKLQRTTTERGQFCEVNSDLQPPADAAAALYEELLQNLANVHIIIFATKCLLCICSAEKIIGTSVSF